MRLAKLSLLLCLLVSCLCMLGCDPPESSFADAGGDYFGIDTTATGEELKAQLHALIDNHEALSYRELWDALAFTDEDPDNPGNVLLIYTGWSLPAEVTVNSARGNKAFDIGGEPYTDRDGPTGCRSDHDSWEPRPQVRGDIARMLFYMAVRYEGPELDLELTEDTAPQGDKAPAHGVRSTLLRWQNQDPPDDLERERNNRIESIQGNRNPFIDRPEFVERIWGE